MFGLIPGAHAPGYRRTPLRGEYVRHRFGSRFTIPFRFINAEIPTPAASNSFFISGSKPWTNSGPASMISESPLRSVEIRPPTRSRASRTVTRTPAATSRPAAASPATPAPTMMTCLRVTRFSIGFGSSSNRARFHFAAEYDPEPAATNCMPLLTFAASCASYPVHLAPSVHHICDRHGRHRRDQSLRHFVRHAQSSLSP